MKLGLFMMPLHPPEKSRTQCFEEDIELVVRADELGFVEAWIGQHLTLAWEPIPANDLFIATVIPRTKRIRLGTILKPYQKPPPPIAMSIIKARSMAARLAGQRGYKPLSTNLVPFKTVAEHWRTYCAGAAEVNRPEPRRSAWSISRSIFVG